MRVHLSQVDLSEYRDVGMKLHCANTSPTKIDLKGVVTIHKLGLCAMTLSEEPICHKQHEGLSKEP